MVKTRKTNNDRFWKLGQQAAHRCSQDFASEIKKTKKGVTSGFITENLKCLPSFLGCFPENNLSSLIVNFYPSFFIVNIDSDHMEGSHWLAIGIFKNSIEIYDPLGFKIFNWNRIPCSLLNFLHRMAVSKRVVVSPRIQSNYSNLCAFYCIFYLLLRGFCSMRKINSFFCTLNSKLSHNDSVLYSFFK